MLTKPPACEGCEYQSKGRGYVPGTGPRDAKIALIGQGPGRDEIATGKPFIGPAGRRLDIWLNKAGLPRYKLYIDNGMRCQVKVRGQDVAPLKGIEECYRRHWGAPVREMVREGAWVVGVGAAVCKFLVGSWCGERAAGSLVEVELP